MSTLGFLIGFVGGLVIAAFDLVWRMRKPNAQGTEAMAGFFAGAALILAIGFLIDIIYDSFFREHGGISLIAGFFCGSVAVHATHLCIKQRHRR